MIAYSNNEKVRMVLFKYDDEAEEIISQNIDSNWDDIKPVSYSQIEGRKENYIGVFIIEDTTLTNSSNIRVIFLESVHDESYAISQSFYGEKVLIMTYSNEYGLREIEEIQLLNQDGELTNN